MHRFTLRVRYGDTDQMGFAYYANYLRWFEIGRAEMIRSAGWSYRAVEEAGVSLPVLEARCRYLEPARYDDLVAIETAILESKRASVRFGYRVRRAEGGQDGSDNRLLAWGSTTHCYLDRRGRPARPPERLAALIEAAPRVSEADLALPTRAEPLGA